MTDTDNLVDDTDTDNGVFANPCLATLIDFVNYKRTSTNS